MFFMMCYTPLYYIGCFNFYLFCVILFYTVEIGYSSLYCGFFDKILNFGKHYLNA